MAMLLLTGIQLSAADIATLDIAALEALTETEPDNLEAHYQLGVHYHRAAVLDCEESLNKALEHFEYVYANEPGRSDAKAFYGSATVLMARYVNVLSKMKVARKGFEILDQSVAANPENFAVRLIRAANSIHCPSFLGRKETAARDVDWLVTTIELNAQDIDPKSIKMGYYYAGKFALSEKNPKAVDYLTNSMNVDTETTMDAEIIEAYQLAEKLLNQQPGRPKLSHRPY